VVTGNPADLSGEGPEVPANVSGVPAIISGGLPRGEAAKASGVTLDTGRWPCRMKDETPGQASN
jgi:hypothetical protein